MPAGSRWKVIGISREQWPLAMAALSLGGDVRVGLEDNFYLPSGEMAKSQRRAGRGGGRAGQAVGPQRSRPSTRPSTCCGRAVAITELRARARASRSSSRAPRAPRCVRMRGGELGVEMKPGDEPVTIADRARVGADRRRARGGVPRRSDHLRGAAAGAAARSARRGSGSSIRSTARRTSSAARMASR